MNVAINIENANDKLVKALKAFLSTQDSIKFTLKKQKLTKTQEIQQEVEQLVSNEVVK